MAKGYTETTPSMASPIWLQSDAGDYREFPAKLNPDSFRDRDAIAIVVGAAGAAENATTIPIDSVTLPLGVTNIPKGTWLNFGTTKVAQLSANFTGGASLSVNAIPTALVDNDVAYHLPFPNRKLIQAGQLVGRTYAERDASTPFGPWAAGDDEVFLLLFDTPNALENADCYLLGHNAVISENFLPNWSTLSALVDEVQTVTITGTLSAGTVTFSANDKEATVAYNANEAAIQAAFDVLFGSSQVVIAGTMASFTVTYSGTGVDELDKAMLDVDIANATGATASSVSETTKGGNGWLTTIRSLYRAIKGAN